MEVVRRALELGARPLLYAAFHHLRLFGWLPAIAAGAVVRPCLVVPLVAMYASVHRERWWQRLVHSALGYGASGASTIEAPYYSEYSPDQKYLHCIHPHGMLVDGIHSAIARHGLMAFDGEPGHLSGVAGRSSALCLAPVIKHLPVHQEMYRDLCSDASPHTIVGWWDRRMPDGSRIDPAIAPGGFSEACFAGVNVDRGIEYLYIKDRKGFLRLAIEHGADIGPAYSFNSTNMYYNIPWLKGLRARISQRIFLGLSWPIGFLGTMIPLTDQCKTVWFPPFRASKYSLDQLDQAHQDYMAHIKHYFDKHKAEYGMAGIELMFVGKDFVDNDELARMLRYLGRTIGLRSKL